jgi:hypothetical protein
MTERPEERAEDWPLRPWIMAGIAAVAGLMFHSLTNHNSSEPLPALRQAGATFVAIAALSFILTIEQRRWLWSLAFAVAWGLVIALVGWFTAGYNRFGNIFEWPYLSGLFAVMLAAPLFQTMRDEGAWRFRYARLHKHAWTDAVIGAASLMFTGIAFLLAWLIAGLFDLIGIEMLRKLLQKEWFCWMLAGFAFGAAVGLLRERETLLATLRRLVMIIYSVLAPVLAVALVMFLASIPFTGLDKLWDSGVPATPLLLLAGAGAILLANAVIGDGRDDRSPNQLLQWSALVLIAVVLPLAAIAALSMGIRVREYGWTPERIWGVIAVAVALAYGIGGWWSIWRGRRDFDDALRPIQTKLAIGLCGVALLLALPILDFGAISTYSQLERLSKGKIAATEFDWPAMAFDFGPAGRKALERIQANGPADHKQKAALALKATSRWSLSEETLTAGPVPLRLTVWPRRAHVPPELSAQLLGGKGVTNPFCAQGGACRVYAQPGGTFAVVMDGCANLPPASQTDPKSRCSISTAVFERRDGKWQNVSDGMASQMAMASPKDTEAASARKRERAALDSGEVTVVPVTVRQLVIGGKPSGPLFK